MFKIDKSVFDTVIHRKVDGPAKRKEPSTWEVYRRFNSDRLIIDICDYGVKVEIFAQKLIPQLGVSAPYSISKQFPYEMSGKTTNLIRRLLIDLATDNELSSVPNEKTILSSGAKATGREVFVNVNDVLDIIDDMERLVRMSK